MDVTHYVVQMFNRGIRHGMELMKSMCAPDPSHRNARGARGLREIGVLGAISAVAVTEATDTSPCRSGQCERQRPEQLVVGAGDDVAIGGRRPRRMRVDHAFEGDRVPFDAGRREVGDRPAQQCVRPGAPGRRPLRNSGQAGFGRDAVDIEKHKQLCTFV